MPYFNAAKEAQANRFMQGFGALGRGLGALLRPESTEEKIQKAEEERRKAAEKRTLEQDALRKELGGLMAAEPGIPGMTPPPPPLPPGVPMSEMVTPRVPGADAPPMGGVNVPGSALFGLPTAPPPSLEVPAPKGLMQTAPVPVPGMGTGEDPRIGNLRRQQALLGQLGQYGEARTVGERIEGLQVSDPPGLVRSELAMVRPDMTKEELRAILGNARTMAGRNRIMALIEKRLEEEREKAGGDTKFSREKELEELRQRGAKERTEMGEKGATERAVIGADSREEVAGMKPPPASPTPKPAITLDAFIENERKKLNRATELARARLNRVTNKFLGSGPAIGVAPETYQKFYDAAVQAEEAEGAFDDAKATEEWTKRYGGGAPAPTVPAPTVPPPAKAPAPPAGVAIPTGVAEKAAAILARHGGDRAKLEADPEYQALKASISTKAFVQPPEPETPESERGYVDPAAEEASAAATMLKRSRIDKQLREARLTDADRRARYAEVLAGGPRYAHLSPEERESMVGRMAAEDDAKIAAIRNPAPGAADPMAAEKAEREKKAGAYAAEQAKQAEEARKKRLGSAANFIER